MLAIFCLRLALGMLASLLLLWTFLINPRFYRTHFLVVFALLVCATVLLWTSGVSVWLQGILCAGLIVCLAGSISWSVHNNPGGRLCIVLGSGLLAVIVWLVEVQGNWFAPLLGAYSSAALLGTATTAMLLGHSYLNAPTMSIKPLQYTLYGLGISLLLRIGFALTQMWLWTTARVDGNLDRELIFWLVGRWVAGLLLVAVLGWMAWETTRIRSTQSATGILYVLVICCFLGELSSLLLLQKTGYHL